MSYYRDNATALAQRAPGNFIGVALYVPMGGASTKPWWNAVALASSQALEEWYDEIAGSPGLYYYLAAFDKTRGAVPVGESIAPAKPGMPGFDVRFQWRHPPFNRPAASAVSGDTGSASAPDEDQGSRLAKIAKTGLVVFGVMWVVGHISFEQRPGDILRGALKPRKHWSQY